MLFKEGLKICKHQSPVHPSIHSQQLPWQKGKVSFTHLKPDLFINNNGPVAEGNGIAEASLALHCLLCGVHDDLGSLRVRMEKQRADGESSTLWDGETVLLLVVASVGGS